MSRATRAAVPVTIEQARRIWLAAQRLDSAEPFGSGPEAARQAVEHLGYVQIDTINVIERCHHHILFTRIPGYRRAHLQQLQRHDKAVFEYWTHALAYVPTRDFAYFLPLMRQHRRAPVRWYENVTPTDLRKVLARIKRDGALTIRDVEDDELVEKEHPWASRKPTKRTLQAASFRGDVTINARTGMLKSYELTSRHFGWEKPPKPATEAQVVAYMLERALRAQGLVSLDSICHLDAKRKAAMQTLIERLVGRGELVEALLDGREASRHWARPESLAVTHEKASGIVRLLSPFDPLVIQRKRLQAFFGYAHRFEAYVPKAKRVLGYFALPVLVDDAIVAAIDLKTDRAAGKMLIQQWTWIDPRPSKSLKQRIETELGRFEAFQLDQGEDPA